MATKISWEHESYPIRKKLDGCNEEYSSVGEFKQHFTNVLSSEKCTDGWVFWTREAQYSSGHEPDNVKSSNVFRKRIPEKITHVLRKIASGWWFSKILLVQFWAPVEVGGRCCLTTLHQPFAVGCSLTKGVSWIREKCMQHYYIADDEADEDQVGPPGRVFRNGSPESSPDILLYSTKEFPLRNFVAGCGLTSYYALPILDLHHNQCVGILEFIQQISHLPRVDDALKEVGMRSTHKTIVENMMRPPQPQREIREMLDLAIKSIPQLYLAQVWEPCKQCGNNSSNFNCMERATFIKDTERSEHPLVDFHEYLMLEFLEACGFHNIQKGQGIVGLALSSTNKLCFSKNLSEFSITEYPMAHYAQQARFSSCCAICLRSKHNGNDLLYAFEFFLQPQSTDGSSIPSVLHLLLKIMEKKLKSFEIAIDRYLGVEYQQPEEHISPIPMKKYEGAFSVLEFKEFFRKTKLDCLQTPRKQVYGWICWSMKGDELSENRGDGSAKRQLNLGTEEIKLLFSDILSMQTSDHPFLIQFWAPKIIRDKLFLSASEQPFALHYLQKELCWYRKQCTQFHYYIGDGAKEEELGPPGRVFFNGHPESSPDLRIYSQREFPLRDKVVCSGARTYLALPLFYFLDKQCFGVLEFVGFPFLWEEIFKKLEKYNLRSTRSSRPPSFPIAEGQKQALSEIEKMLELVKDSPQLQAASVWIFCSQCANIDIEVSCMEPERFSTAFFYEYRNDLRIHEFLEACKFHQVLTRKGIIAKVLESESNLYFCEQLCSLSICEQPLAHYAQVARLETCFGICLQSSYTGNSFYIIEFFLSPHSKKIGYSTSLCFLLSTMKQILKSFKVSPGQLAEVPISIATELGHEMEHDLSKNVVHFESDGVDSHKYVEDINLSIKGFSTENQVIVEKFGGQCNLPFKNVQYGNETEHQYSENQIRVNGMDDASNTNDEQEQNIADAIIVEDEAQNVIDSNFEEGKEREKSSMSFHVSYEELEFHFGRSRKDAAKNLGVSISTLKRKCRDYGIKRWPSRLNNIKNPSLFRKKIANKCAENADHQTSAPSGFDLKTSDFPIELNLSSPSIQKTTELANTFQMANVVIKAKFKDDTLRFEFCVSRGVKKLMEEVGKRIKLKIGEFKLKYVDDDGELILLPCDEDLDSYVKSMKSLGKTTVKVSVHLISE